MTWKTIVPNEVWTKENFLPEHVVDNLLSTNYDNLKKINNINTPPVMFDTKFDYNILSDKNFRNQYHRDVVFSILDEFSVATFFKKLPTNNLHHMQYFYKQNDPSSAVAFDLHAEDKKIYGDFVFMLYLSNEDTGAIEFPSKEDARNDWSKGFQEMCDDFEVRFSHYTKSVLPKKNMCVIAKTGIAHKVYPCKGIRPNITGWPFFKEEELYTLDAWSDYKDVK